MFILVAHNEPTGIIEELRTTFELSAVPLECGDIHIPLPTGLLIIERKTVTDLLASISDGRLFSQVERMANTGRFNFLVVHGSLIYDAADHPICDGRTLEKWNGLAVRAALRAVQLAGVAVEIVRESDYLKTVKEIISICIKPKHEQRPRRAITFPPLAPEVQFLATLVLYRSGDGREVTLGPEKAKALLEWARSFGHAEDDRRWNVIEAISKATLIQADLVPGVPVGWGKKTYDQFLNALGLKPGEMVIYDYHKKVSE